MKVIIINGSASVGKDQFANFFKKHYKHKSVNWSTIDKVKKVSKKHFGWNGKKTNEARLFLSEIKRVWSEFNNGPFEDINNKIFNHYSKLNKKDRKNIVYFIHCREPHEIKKFIEKYNDLCLTILLKRDNVEVPNNESDKNVMNFTYDYVIDNNGDKKLLKEQVLNFIKILKNNQEYKKIIEQL